MKLLSMSEPPPFQIAFSLRYNFCMFFFILALQIVYQTIYNQISQLIEMKQNQITNSFETFKIIK